MFTYTSNGIALGGLVGLSAGYLVGRDADWNDFRWRPLAYGAGIGALTGGAVGLTLGIVDMARDSAGMGAYILRDTGYGADFGTVIGALAGGLAFLSTNKGEHVLLGAAIGTLAGSGLGLGLGIVSGSRAEPHRKRSALPVTVALGAAPGADGAPVWLPVVVGRY